MRLAIPAAGFACLVLSVLLCGSVEARWGWPRRKPPLNATEIFNSADDNDDDCLSIDELVVALSKSGVWLPVWIVTKIHDHYDENADDCLDLDEFKKIIDARNSVPRWGWPRRRTPLNATEIFNSADDNDDDCLSVDELVVALSKSRVKLRVWIVTKIHNYYDENADGCRDLDEFKKIIVDIDDSVIEWSSYVMIFGFPFYGIPIVASEIFDSSDYRPDDGCLNRVELYHAIWKLCEWSLRGWVIDVLLAEYATDDTCMTSTEYTAFVADLRDLRRAEIFDDAGDSSPCLTATQFQKAIREAVHAYRLALWNVNMLLDLYDTDSDGCISKGEFDAFMDVLED